TRPTKLVFSQWRIGSFSIYIHNMYFSFKMAVARETTLCFVRFSQSAAILKSINSSKNICISTSPQHDNIHLNT
ncbi:hypothetical protein L9F63_007520, partial [Diploptera punctata]